MTKRKCGWLTLVFLAFGPAIFAAEQNDEAPDTELLEFLGAMSEEFDEWELFLELSIVEIPPEFVQTEFLETEDE